MNSHYTYLLLNLSCVIFPLILSFDKKVAFYKTWKHLLPAMLIVGVFFVLWDMFFTACNIWSFNYDYVIGIKIYNLPFEEVLFFFTIPYACAFIYEVLKAYINREVLGCGKGISIAVMTISLGLCIVYYNKTYTLVNAGICFGVVLFSQFIYKFRNMGRFYLSYFVSLLPFLMCNGLITGLPIVIYDDSENMGKRILTIPFEDVFYCLTLLLGTVVLMDYFKTRKEVE